METPVNKIAINENGIKGTIKCRKFIRGKLKWVGITENKHGDEMLWLAEDYTLVTNHQEC